MATLKETIKELIRDIKRDELYFYNDNRCFKFIEANPENTDLLVINEKISAMNNGIIDLHYVPSMAKHIQSLHIDPYLQNSELEIVPRISALLPDKPYEFRKLASTYCNFHFPDVYPVQSDIAEKIMGLYTQHIQNNGHPTSVLSYSDFKIVTDHFSSTYDLQAFDYYELEKFLWLKSRMIIEFLENPDRDSQFDPPAK
ncbi:hypothetical protein [Fulvivirga sedimenti]|uniref:Uncharacterized protein n=1 Tax=Fulvivirga sedimenti TaxID=2879465 RepID=A0A9X1HPD8_9BACT|nr:hypothetical protein [Fulvivirga sedimenti]MCA6075510.1 hypothetical protein [Fulvivirga sedimenti]MCA6076687.1 hypothetical protein [Fulvivirga sedimenti]MCA6077815.1 hypothetical protein [Fulvivirga sedimenti]